MSVNLIAGGCSQIEGAKSPLPKLCYTYPTMMKLGSYTLPQEDPKNIWITWRIPWVLLTSAFFTENQQILLYQEIQMKISFWCVISNFFKLFWVFKDWLKNMVTILMTSAKMATLGLFKIKLLWNNSYDVIIPVHDVTNKILSRNSNNIVDGSCDQSFVTLLYILYNSNFIRIWPEKRLFL